MIFNEKDDNFIAAINDIVPSNLTINKISDIPKGRNVGFVVKTNSRIPDAKEMQTIIEDEIGLEETEKQRVFIDDLKGGFSMIACEGYDSYDDVEHIIKSEIGDYQKIYMSDKIMERVKAFSEMRDYYRNDVETMEAATKGIPDPNGYVIEYTEDGTVKESYVRETEDDAKRFCQSMQENDMFGNGSWSYRPNYDLDDHIVSENTVENSFEMS